MSRDGGSSSSSSSSSNSRVSIVLSGQLVEVLAEGCIPSANHVSRRLLLLMG
jgi:hypothetical protein